MGQRSSARSGAPRAAGTFLQEHPGGRKGGVYLDTEETSGSPSRFGFTNSASLVAGRLRRAASRQGSSWELSAIEKNTGLKGHSLAFESPQLDQGEVTLDGFPLAAFPNPMQVLHRLRHTGGPG